MNKSLTEIKEKYKSCNLLMPLTTEAQLNPFYKLVVMEVQADTSEHSGDIFKVGSIQSGKTWVDVYSPAKPLLMKLAAAAGIQFDPANTYGTYISKNCYKAKAYGALRMPDGTGKTHCDEKVINLDDEEDKLRLEFLDKSIQGITDPKAAKEAEKLFKGKWIDSQDKYGKPCKAYKIDESDRQAYIERGVLVNMTLLRKTFAEKAMTGAILRVVRALIGLKGTYTLEELKKPFAIPRVTFAPDYSDPTVRSAMLEQGISSMGNMFGGPNILPEAVPEKQDIIGNNFNPEEFVDNEAFASNAIDNPAGEFDLPPEPELESVPEEQPNVLRCELCEREISEKVANYSTKQYKRMLCMSCQKEV